MNKNIKDSQRRSRMKGCTVNSIFYKNVDVMTKPYIIIVHTTTATREYIIHCVCVCHALMCVMRNKNYCGELGWSNVIVTVPGKTHIWYCYKSLLLSLRFSS